MNAHFPPPYACRCVDHEIAILRLVDAPPEAVFAAWIEPRHLAAWWGPWGGHSDWQSDWHSDRPSDRPSAGSSPRFEIDPRRDGAYRIAVRGDEGEVAWAGGIFRELDPPRGLAFTHAWEVAGRLEQPRLVLVDFAPADGRTRLSFSISGFSSAASRDSEIEPWHACLDRLVRYFLSDE